MNLLSKTFQLLLVIYLFIQTIITPAFAGDVNGSMNFGGKNRTYLLHIPTGYNASNPTPLVLVFHGLTVTGPMMANITNFSPLADQENFLVVYPDGLNKKWSTPNGAVDDVGFISALIDLLSVNYNVDADRIFATGASNGGMFTYRLGLELTERFAGIASVAGYLPNYGPAPFPVPSRPLPVAHFHGTDDSVIPYGEAENATEYWTEFNNCSVVPETVHLPNVEVSDGTTVDEMIYANGSNNTEVDLYEIYGGGHTWPGSSSSTMPGKVTKDISASEIIWAFFKSHSQNTAPSVSFTKPVVGVQFTAPASIVLKATAADADGTIKNVQFLNGTTNLKKDQSAQYSYTWNNVPAGIYTIIAIATDDKGATASDTTNIIVAPLKSSFENSSDQDIEARYDASSNDFIITNMNNSTPYDILLFDVSGRQMLSFQNVNDATKSISTSSFGQGLYLYKIISAPDQSLSGKFVVSR